MKQLPVCARLTSRLATLFCCIFVAAPAAAQTPVGTAFTYQGRLGDGGQPANGSYDLELKLYDAQTGGNQVGSTLTLEDVAVSSGLFSVSLDFGSVFGGSKRWLQIGLRAGASSGAFTLVSPRQELTPVPHAAYSAQSGDALFASAFFPGPLVDPAWTAGRIVPDRSIVATRAIVRLKTPGDGCDSPAVVRLTDGSFSQDLFISGANTDSGPLALNFAAGANVDIALRSGATGCDVDPANANVIVEYKMGSTASNTCAVGNAACGGVCTTLALDVNNCGSCGDACSNNHISPACSGSQCNGTCNPGWADCDTNKRTNGCEVNTDSSLNNCGACSNVCNSQVADTCAAGSCKCGSGAACVAGQACAFGQCVCTAASCPTGCCSGNTCTASSFSSCGTNGNACIACSAFTADNCFEGGCRCGSSPACSGSFQCISGACVPEEAEEPPLSRPASRP